MQIRPPVISFAGYSDSGKTTFIEKLVRYLSEAGIAAAYIKHTHHLEYKTDEMGTDTGRMKAAGAVISEIHHDEAEILDRCAELKNCDIIIIEGLKHGPFKKILVTMENDHLKWPVQESECIAIISDVISNGDTDIPVYSRDDIVGFADFLKDIMEK